MESEKGEDVRSRPSGSCWTTILTENEAVPFGSFSEEDGRLLRLRGGGSGLGMAALSVLFDNGVAYAMIPRYRRTVWRPR